MKKWENPVICELGMEETQETKCYCYEGEVATYGLKPGGKPNEKPNGKPNGKPECGHDHKPGYPCPPTPIPNPNPTPGEPVLS